MLKFLFYTILALVIFVPTVLWGAKFLKLSDKTFDSYNKLIGLIGSIKEDEILSLPFYMDKKSALAGFSKMSNKLENYEFLSRLKSSGKLTSMFNKPNECQDKKACICLCEGYDLDKKTEPKTSICDKKLICNSFDNIDILSEKLTHESYNRKAYDYWDGGFLFLGDQNALRTLYVQRYKNSINLCFSGQCITDEIKEIIDINAVIDAFNLFTKKYEECKAKINGLCETIKIDIPESYYIYYSSTINAKSGFYLSKGDTLGSFDKIEFLKDEEGNEITFPGLLLEDENNEFPSGNIFKNDETNLKVKDSKVILLTTESGQSE